MMKRSHDRRSHFLKTLSSWRLMTVPAAAALVLVQTFGVLFSQVQAATRAYGNNPNPTEIPSPLPADPAGTPAAQTAGQIDPAGGTAVSDERRAEIMAQARAEMYHFSPDNDAASPGVLTGSNPDHGFDLAYSGQGMTVTPKTPAPNLLNPTPAEPDWQVRLTARSLTLDTTSIPLEARPSNPIANKERISAQLAVGINEWYVNRPEGIEHGFTIEDPGLETEHLAVDLKLDTMLVPVLRNDEIHFQDAHARTQLIYRGLHVYDHTGRELPSAMTLTSSPPNEGPRITLSADVGGAVFPVTIDPLMVDQQAMPMASDAATGDEYGFASAGEDNLLVVTAPGNGSGKAYVYHRNQDGANQWGEQGTLEIPDGENPTATDRFGEAVAIGTIPETGQQFIAVGAPEFDGTGAVFIFTNTARGVNPWRFVAKIIVAGLVPGSKFGCSLSMAGTLLAIGAYGHLGIGAVFVFTLLSGVWTIFQTILGSDLGLALGSEFGRSVAITLRNLLIGAPGETITIAGPVNPGVFARAGAAYLLTRLLVAGALFSLLSRSRLSADNEKIAANNEFGWAVALTLTMIAIGAPNMNYFDGSISNTGAIFLFAFYAATASWAWLWTLFGPAAGYLLGFSVALNHSNDLAGGCPGATHNYPGDGLVKTGIVLIYLFNTLNFLTKPAQPWTSYDSPVTVAPSGFPYAPMLFGRSVVLIGTLLFVMAMGYNALQGAMYRFLLTATVLTYLAWQAIHFTAPQIANGDADKNVDFSGDGFPNVVKWAMGLIPTIYNAGVFQPVIENGNFLIKVPQSRVASGAVLLILYSLALTTWFLYTLGPLSTFFTKTTERGITQDVHTISLPTSATNRIHLRTSALENP